MKYQLHQPLSIHELGQRQNQEDSIYPVHGAATPDDRLFLLCDGMGGHECGEVASRIVCQEVSTFIRQVANPGRAFSDSMVSAAMESMYNVLDANDTGGDKKMGTTMVMLYFQPGGVIAGHIGDSRYYHIRPATHQIMYRSKDHSLVTQLYEAGEIRRSEMATAKGKNIILRAVMPHQDHLEMPDLVHIKDVQPGDLFYMCSDGMLEQMSDEEILDVFCNTQLTLEQKRDWLISATTDNHDNHTAYLIEVQDVEHDAIDAATIDDEQEARLSNKALMALELGDEAVEQGPTQPTATMPEPASPYVVEAVVPEEEPHQAAPAAQPASHTRTAAPRRTQKSGNGKLYAVIAVLVFLIALLLAGFFLMNNKKETKTEETEQVIVSPTSPNDEYDEPIINRDSHSGSTITREEVNRRGRTDVSNPSKTSKSVTTQPNQKSKGNFVESVENPQKSVDNLTKPTDEVTDTPSKTTTKPSKTTTKKKDRKKGNAGDTGTTTEEDQNLLDNLQGA